MSAGVLAWPVESEPSWPVVIAWIMSSASPERHSPTMIRSGRMWRALRSRSRIVISPWPFDVRRPRLERDDVRLAELELGGVLDRDDPLVLGDERRQDVEAVVVLPEPVPPETKTLSRASTQALRNSNISAVAVPNADQVLDRDRLGRELADGDDRPDERQRLDDRVDARAVGQPGVDPRAGLRRSGDRAG